MPSKLFLVVDAHDKFEISSFSRSRDIGVRILKMWASSVDSTLSGFSRSAFLKLQSTILWNLNAICQRAAELERCNRFSNCRTLGAPIGQMDLRIRGPGCMVLRQMKAQTSMLYGVVLDIWIFAPFLNQSARSAIGVENRCKFSNFLTPMKAKGGLVEWSVRIIRATPRFYTR